ncbi:hypothetical protein XENOCAPTIV_009767 [Xenoophorus captivus]|uniref:Uncharacterized protein n=1 Tax=Xenoophorus captivus TaxID=1517983 RepID=A0ABV0S283_9TELE
MQTRKFSRYKFMFVHAGLSRRLPFTLGILILPYQKQEMVTQHREKWPFCAGLRASMNVCTWLCMADILCVYVCLCRGGDNQRVKNDHKMLCCIPEPGALGFPGTPKLACCCCNGKPSPNYQETATDKEL